MQYPFDPRRYVNLCFELLCSILQDTLAINLSLSPGAASRPGNPGLGPL